MYVSMSCMHAMCSQANHLRATVLKTGKHAARGKVAATSTVSRAFLFTLSVMYVYACALARLQDVSD